MNRGCFNAMFAAAVSAGMLVASAIGSAAVGAAAAAGLQASASVAEHSLAAQSAVASAPGHALTAPHAPGDAMVNIDACVARLEPQLDIGYDRIAARCPDLMRELEAGAWAPWLPRGWKESGNDLSAGSLKELRELVTRESH